MKYETIATEYSVWKSHFDTSGEISEEEFNELSLEEKLEMIEEAFGLEQ